MKEKLITRPHPNRSGQANVIRLDETSQISLPGAVQNGAVGTYGPGITRVP